MPENNGVADFVERKSLVDKWLGMWILIWNRKHPTEKNLGHGEDPRVVESWIKENKGAGALEAIAESSKIFDTVCIFDIEGDRGAIRNTGNPHIALRSFAMSGFK